MWFSIVFCMFTRGYVKFFEWFYHQMFRWFPRSVSLSFNGSIPFSDGFFHGLNLDIKPPRLIVKHNVFVVKKTFLHNEIPYLTVKCCSVWFFNPIGGKDKISRQFRGKASNLKNPMFFPFFPMIGGFIKSLDPIFPDLPRLAHGASAAASFRGSLSLSEARSCRGMAGVALNGRYTTGNLT